MAVKAEIESWNLFDAAEEIAYDNMERGATLIPLGELFTRKRTGKFKFRQIAMGNMLKAGRDYGETFSTVVSGDGSLRSQQPVERECTGGTQQRVTSKQNNG